MHPFDMSDMFASSTPLIWPAGMVRWAPAIGRQDQWSGLKRSHGGPIACWKWCTLDPELWTELGPGSGPGSGFEWVWSWFGITTTSTTICPSLFLMVMNLHRNAMRSANLRCSDSRTTPAWSKWSMQSWPDPSCCHCWAMVCQIAKMKLRWLWMCWMQSLQRRSHRIPSCRSRLARWFLGGSSVTPRDYMLRALPLPRYRRLKPYTWNASATPKQLLRLWNGLWRTGTILFLCARWCLVNGATTVKTIIPCHHTDWPLFIGTRSTDHKLATRKFPNLIIGLLIGWWLASWHCPVKIQLPFHFSHSRIPSFPFSID